MENEEKNKILADLIYPDITETISDLEKRYPERDLKKGACVTRFAPSPTGFLHTGALFTSLVNRQIAKQSDGVFFLRIEDTDRKREVEGSADLLVKQMNIFGITPDEGVIASDKEIGDYGPYVQSKREKIYKICAKELIKKGRAYPCFCTPEMLKATHDMQEKSNIKTGYYSIYARCRNISVDEAIQKVRDGQKYIIRFRSFGSHLKKVSFVDAIRGKIEMPENEQDIVIIKSDGLPTYHFAHAVDDHFMRTTHVMRGEEWIPSTPIHIELFNALGFKLPIYAHFPSVMVQDGASKRKLSKRKDKEAAVSYFLEEGYPIESIIEYLLTIINSDFEPWRMKNPNANKYDFKIRLEKMNSSGALFDKDKLNDVSKEVIARYSSQKVLDDVVKWSKEYDKKLYNLINSDLDYSLKVFALERDNVKKIRKDLYKYNDVEKIYFYFFDEPFKKEIEKNGYMFDYDKDLVKKVISGYIKVYDDKDDKNTWFEKTKEAASSLGFCINMKQYKQEPDKYIGSIADYTEIIRISITNRKNTPDIYSIMQILGLKKVIKRFENVLNM